MAVPVLSGCGSTLSMKASVEAICSKRNRATNVVDVTSTSEKSFKRVARGRATVEQDALSELLKLKAPASQGARWREFLNSRRELVIAWGKFGNASESDIKQGQDLLTAVAVIQRRVLALAKQAGYTQCTQIG